MIQQLSKRLETVASFVTKGNRVADVGCDHGYVPIFLVQNKIAPYAIAMDINKGPLLHADENIKRAGLDHLIETRLSNGLVEYNKNEAHSIIIAGMGGGLMIDILSTDIDKWQSETELILSPQSDIELVRRFLCDNHMTIVRETMLIEDGKYYTIMKAVSGEEHYDSVEEYRYGKLLLTEKNEVLHKFLIKELSNKEKICDALKAASEDIAKKRMEEVHSEIEVINSALRYYT